MQHLIYFDGTCDMCNAAVRFLKKRDKKNLFRYEPLGEETDSLILMENGEKELRYGKASLRIAWYLGGWWRLLGFLSFLPTFLADAIYKVIARNRHLF